MECLLTRSEDREAGDTLEDIFVSLCVYLHVQVFYVMLFVKKHWAARTRRVMNFITNKPKPTCVHVDNNNLYATLQLCYYVIGFSHTNVFGVHGKS